MSTSSEQQPTVAEIEERCKAILVNFDSGNSPEASEIKFNLREVFIIETLSKYALLFGKIAILVNHNI